MKFEQLYFFLNFLINFRFFFFFKFFNQIFDKFLLRFFFYWKISNYADGYWFLYSNKKTIHELRYLSKN